ncbi:hypothetical protein ASG90_00765 [Nocardioides sp. Soil797]|nr:hypothetical protein ASG90_00765 [Nocardioides sp. Soil797]
MSFSVLFVCIGNVCRSPFGERLLRLRLDELGIGDEFTVTSAGVRAMRGRAMHPESARTLEERGGSADGFVARQLSAELAEEADLVVAATRDIRSRLLEESPRSLRRTFTVREFVALAEAHRAAGEGQTGARAAAPVRQRGKEALSGLVEDCSRGRGILRLDDVDITDPIGRSAQTYDAVAELMDDQVTRLARVLNSPL